MSTDSTSHYGDRWHARLNALASIRAGCDHAALVQDLARAGLNAGDGLADLTAFVEALRELVDEAALHPHGIADAVDQFADQLAAEGAVRTDMWLAAMQHHQP
ncbi:hypothetical protein [Actinomycetospora flava]|uniref:Uncharacterized protein n=1 Tax=Actinomycetospora flava TaxID=3129232 RepID=A0ABU8LZN0_9PSEU